MPPQGDMGYNSHNMMVFMLCLLVVFFGLLVLVGSFTPVRSARSDFEFKRLLKNNNPAVIAEQRREELLDDVVSLQNIVAALLLVAFTAVAVARFDWPLGIVLSVLVAVIYGAVGRIGFVSRVAAKLYRNHEQRSLRFVEKFARVFRYIRHTPRLLRPSTTVASRQEFIHMIDQSNNILSDHEKKQIDHGLRFSGRHVQEIMTPADQIASIAKNELLGPLVLHDLHQTGHRQFPVLNKDIDHILGILVVDDFLSLDSKRSITAEKAMDSRVYYVHKKQTLPQALAVCLDAHSQLLVVIDDTQATVGLVSLNDIISAMIGYNIDAAGDGHDDIRTVSDRKPSGR